MHTESQHYRRLTPAEQQNRRRRGERSPHGHDNHPWEIPVDPVPNGMPVKLYRYRGSDFGPYDDEDA